MRLVALIDGIEPAAPDPSTGRQYRRVLVPPTTANEFLDWGDSGGKQIAGAMAAVSRRGVCWSGTPLAYFDFD